MYFFKGYGLVTCWAGLQRTMVLFFGPKFFRGVQLSSVNNLWRDLDAKVKVLVRNTAQVC